MSSSNTLLDVSAMAYSSLQFDKLRSPKAAAQHALQGLLVQLKSIGDGGVTFKNYKEESADSYKPFGLKWTVLMLFEVITLYMFNGGVRSSSLKLSANLENGLCVLAASKLNAWTSLIKVSSHQIQERIKNTFQNGPCTTHHNPHSQHTPFCREIDWLLVDASSRAYRIFSLQQDPAIAHLHPVLLSLIELKSDELFYKIVGKCEQSQLIHLHKFNSRQHSYRM